MAEAGRKRQNATISRRCSASNAHAVACFQTNRRAPGGEIERHCGSHIDPGRPFLGAAPGARSERQTTRIKSHRAAFRDESAICEWGCEIAADIASLPIGSRRHLHRQPPLLESPRNEGCRPQFG